MEKPVLGKTYGRHHLTKEEITYALEIYNLSDENIESLFYILDGHGTSDISGFNEGEELVFIIGDFCTGKSSLYRLLSVLGILNVVVDSRDLTKPNEQLASEGYIYTITHDSFAKMYNPHKKMDRNIVFKTHTHSIKKAIILTDVIPKERMIREILNPYYDDEFINKAKDNLSTYNINNRIHSEWDYESNFIFMEKLKELNDERKKETK